MGLYESMMSAFTCMVCSLVGNTASVRFFDSFEDGKIAYGPSDKTMSEFSILADDPVGNVPDSFTICSSLYFSFRTSVDHFCSLDERMEVLG